jgi:uroporphyrin-III C-methyltransferase
VARNTKRNGMVRTVLSRTAQHRLIAEHGPLPGEVWLVGAGPGDPGLLTIRAASAIGLADVIFYDALPGNAVLEMARPDAKLVGVGKRKAREATQQRTICALMIEAARNGARVVRLKGGDPFVFGRGGEEITALAKAGINFSVVPGVSSGLAAPAAAHIPLTHRGIASAVTFVTAHDERGTMPGLVDWHALARSGATLVLFMAQTRLSEVVVELLAAEMRAETPVAIISQATLPGERVIFSTLGACTLTLQREALPRPSIIVIGRVASLPLEMGMLLPPSPPPALAVNSSAV